MEKNKIKEREKGKGWEGELGWSGRVMVKKKI